MASRRRWHPRTSFPRRSLQDVKPIVTSLLLVSFAVAFLVSSELSPSTVLPANARRPATPPARRVVCLLGATAAASTLDAQSAVADGGKSRDEGYAVQKSSDDWSRSLTPLQYRVLREGGTEAPGSSPLLKEKRVGTFACAGCGAPLFASAEKFESGTGWPSFAAAMKGVQVEDTNPVQEALLGAELRCGNCGGHLGHVFGDGWIYPGSPAFATGKRHCIDGAALTFLPADGAPPRSGTSRGA
eukprot:TRINITY_DN21909_c0_g1_i3.p1 TRINITY_DN21909_c0_g1~~TRINITY_DN21909_c0_g1_i3.p1  ORF type:complete len:243 (-),score=26.47 TRINITY_DN21909_c0_g1_i3:123-851(-)